MNDPGTENPADSPDRPDGSAGKDLDARFADIVAHWDDGSAPTERSYAAPRGPRAPTHTHPPGPARDDARSTSHESEAQGTEARGTEANGTEADSSTAPESEAHGTDVRGAEATKDESAARAQGTGRYADETGSPAVKAKPTQDLDADPAPAPPPDDLSLPAADAEARPPGLPPATEPPPAREIVVPWRAPSPGPGPDGLDEHFVPPIPEPLPAGDLQFWAIIVGLVGGPLLLLYLMVFAPDAPNWWMLVAVAATAGGFGLLVSRLPAGRDDEDNGARV